MPAVESKYMCVRVCVCQAVPERMKTTIMQFSCRSFFLGMVVPLHPTLMSELFDDYRFVYLWIFDHIYIYVFLKKRIYIYIYKNQIVHKGPSCIYTKIFMGKTGLMRFL